MIAKIAGGVLGAIFVSALILVGVAFLAFAIDISLAPHLGDAWAAVLTAFILLIIPLAAWVVVTIQAAAARKRRNEEVVLGALAMLLKETPLMAIGGAALVGVVSKLMKRRKR